MTRWPLVGRAAQLGRVADKLRRPGGLVVCGGAGTGKTRLLAAARERVGNVYWATGAPGVPLGPFAPLLPRAADGAALPAQLSLAAAALVARRGAVAVDDAHRLDAASAALLAHLVANTSVPVVLTVRTTDPLPWLRDLDRLTLGPLTPTEVGEVLEQALDGPVETALVARLAELSGGNPLLLREIVDAATLHREQGVWRSSGPIVAADNLPAAIAARLDRLPPHVRATAELVALAEPVPVEVLDRLLDPAELAGLDDERLLESRSREVRLVHPLYGESLRATVPPMRARDHYRRLAELPLAVRWLREAVALMPITGLPASPHLWSLDALAEAYALVGDAEAAAATVERLRAVLPAGFVALRAAGAVWAVAAGGETSRARDLALEHADALEGVGSFLMAGWSLHDAHRLGDTGVAAALERLADRSQSPLLRAMAANAAAAGPAAAGPATANAAAAGPPPPSTYAGRSPGVAADSAAGGLAALGCDLWAVETYVRAGHLHRAGGHLAPALASTAAAERLLARCGPVRVVPPAVADPLTGREREVVDLATRGHRDRDIAERLNLSVRTVQSHLYRAYRKLGVDGRHHLP